MVYDYYAAAWDGPQGRLEVFVIMIKMIMMIVEIPMIKMIMIRML